MFRSFASALISFLAILLFAFTILFLWNGSEGIHFTRVAFEGDRSTLAIMEEFRREQMKIADAARLERERGSKGMTDETPAPVATGTGGGPAVVVWISIPGFRGDYLEKSETPFFDKLATDGGATNKMRPNFPCLTFPAHATMATGVTADKHGIIADQIRTAPGELVKEPLDDALLLAEPIWVTATRQGVKTLVYDWPLSQKQSGEHKVAYSLDSYDAEATDEVRLARVLEQWRASAKGGGGTPPADANATAAEAEAPSPAPAGGGSDKLRLLMFRLDDIGKQGLVHGPRADETYATVSATDKALQTFFDTVQAEWTTLAPENANLVIFITTDHGIAEVTSNVNISRLLGPDMMAKVDIVAHDAIANLYFKDLPENEGEKKIVIEKFDKELGTRIYYRPLKKEALPAEWSYLNEGRTGDRVLVLKSPYIFTDLDSEEPLFESADGKGHFGGFGYPVEEASRMSGQIILAGIPNSPLSGPLEGALQTGFHATVCKILGIDPAEGASKETLPLK